MNIAISQLQAITQKSIVAVHVVILLWLEKKHPVGLMGNHLKEIEQGMVQNYVIGENKYLKGIITLANIVEIKDKYKHIILLNGQKMKAKGLMLIMGLRCVLIVMGKYTGEILGIEQKRNANVANKLKEKVNIADLVHQKNNGKDKRTYKYCDVIVRRMLNLDDNLTIKRNGQIINKNLFNND